MKTRTMAALGTLLALSLGGCGGSSSGPPPPPPPPLPTISSFAAQPSWVITGQGVTLRWAVSGATKLSISGVGAVSGSSVQVSPAADTTYVLTASNDSGSTQAQTTLDVYPPPTVWFAPLPHYVNSNLGAVDFLDLFSAAAPWGTAASHIQVFKIWTSELDYFSDVDLSNMFADLKRRHIALAIEWGPLEPNGCGSGEGFDGALALHYAQKIRENGGTLQYIAFDEPFAGGSLASPPDACHWSADQVAQDALRHLAMIRTVFPDAIVGDIEVLPAQGVAPD